MAAKTELPGAQVPENLVRDLEKMATWEPKESPRAAAMLEAADVLRHLPVRQSDEARIDSPALRFKGYQMHSNVTRKIMRIVCFGKEAQRDVRGYFELDPTEAYEFAHTILKNYDKLEGIK